MAAIACIEELLHLDECALSNLVGPSQRVGPFGTPTFPLNERALEAAVTDVFTQLGEPHFDRSRDVTVQGVTDVGPDGSVTSRSMRSLVQSMSGVITHVPYVELTPGVRTPPPNFRVLGGGRISALHSHESGEVHGFSIELERPIDTAQTAMIEWAVDLHSDYPATRETGHGVARQCRELLLWTRFHPDAPPDWIEEVEESPSGITTRPIVMDSGTSVHQVRRRFGPGILSLRWGYGDRE